MEQKQKQKPVEEQFGMLAVGKGHPMEHGVFSDLHIDVVVEHCEEVERVVSDVEFGGFGLQGLVRSYSLSLSLSFSLCWLSFEGDYGEIFKVREANLL